MLSPSIEKALNNQLKLELESSQLYLSMACWADANGFAGTSAFLFEHADEEREHMLKFIHYMNERGADVIVPSLEKPHSQFDSILQVFEMILEHEEMVTAKISEIVGICLDERDFTTQNFMQWFISEQIEEESLFRTILDKLRMVGNDKGGLYLFDRDLSTTSPEAPAE